MNDDFLSQLRRPPRPQFAAALYRRLNQSAPAHTVSGFAPGWARARGGLMKRGMALAIFTTLAAALLTVALVPAAQASIIDVLKKIVLGPNTTLVQVAPTPNDTPKPLPEDMWSIHTDIGTFGGNVAPSVEPMVRSVDSLQAAQALVDYPLKTPAEMPAGYSLREIKLAPVGKTTHALLFYSGPGHDIIIAELPGGPHPGSNASEVVSVGTGAITDGPAEEVDFDGQPAAWINGHTLLWETEGISFEVGGLGLDLPGAMVIARSLR